MTDQPLIIKEIRTVEAKDFAGKYKIDVWCFNCGKKTYAFINKGIPKKGLTTSCPNCEVQIKL